MRELALPHVQGERAWECLWPFVSIGHADGDALGLGGAGEMFSAALCHPEGKLQEVTGAGWMKMGSCATFSARCLQKCVGRPRYSLPVFRTTRSRYRLSACQPVDWGCQALAAPGVHWRSGQIHGNFSKDICYLLPDRDPPADVRAVCPERSSTSVWVSVCLSAAMVCHPPGG
jgi:hypothetical protein